MTEQEQRNLSDADVIAIVDGLHAKIDAHSCRFPDISPEALNEAVKFYQNFNKLIEDTGKTALKTIIICLTTGTLGLLILGIYAKLKKDFGI